MDNQMDQKSVRRNVLTKMPFRIIAAIAVVMVGFQNCSQVEFQEGADGVSGLKASDLSHADDLEIEVPPPDGSNSSGLDESHFPSRCGSISIDDVILNIETIAIDAGGLEIDGPGEISMAQLLKGVALTLPEEVATNQVRFVLAEEGNRLLASDGSSLELKTPSQQETGLKINLKLPTVFEEGKTYTLQVAFDAKTQIVRAGEKCLLKPHLKLVALN